MTGINEVAKEIHENARTHGWWDEERGFPEILALIHSEVSEALEEYRNGHDATEIYFSDSGKPEGIPTELTAAPVRFSAVDCPICGCQIALADRAPRIDLPVITEQRDADAEETEGEAE